MMCNFDTRNLKTFVFYACGVLGHTQRFCDKLYSMEIDDRTRNREPELRAEFNKSRAGSGSRWSKDGGDTPATSNNDGAKTEEQNYGNNNANNVLTYSLRYKI
jgi:hypothetical protein